MSESELTSYKKISEKVGNISLESQNDNQSTSGFSSYQSQAELCPDNNLEKKVEKEEYTGFKRYWGMILTVLSSFALSCVNLMAKILPEYGFSAYSISFWRYMGMALFAFPILLFCQFRRSEKEKNIFASVWPPLKMWRTWLALISRGIIGSSSAILRFLALNYLTVGDTAVIAYSSPALVAVLAHFFLGERCGVVPIIVSLTTILGVGVVAKPPLITGQDSFDNDNLTGIAFACGSMICAALMVIITRKIRQVHFALMLTIFGLIGIAQALIMGQGRVKIPTSFIAPESGLVAGVAIFSALGQLGVILAVKYEQAGPVSLLRSNDVIFSFILQFIFLNVIPDEYSIIGGLIVLIGVLVIALRKWISTMEDETWGKTFFGWVLY